MLVSVSGVAVVQTVFFAAAIAAVIVVCSTIFFFFTSPVTNPLAAFREWLFCSGGLVSLMICVQFAYHWLVFPLLKGRGPTIVTRRDALKTVGSKAAELPHLI